MNNVYEAVEHIIEEVEARPLPEDGDIVRAIYSVVMEVGMDLNKIFKEIREEERCKSTETS